ncbi:MAG: hypothetical protein ACFFB2_20575 [Promethearchaeota archaeon]
MPSQYLKEVPGKITRKFVNTWKVKRKKTKPTRGECIKKHIQKNLILITKKLISKVEQLTRIGRRIDFYRLNKIVKYEIMLNYPRDICITVSRCRYYIGMVTNTNFFLTQYATQNADNLVFCDYVKRQKENTMCGSG